MKTTRDVMFDLLRRLDKEGFILHYLQAYSTNSCYIKMDFGVCKSIRIADHKGIDKYAYTFNLMLGLDKSYEEDGRYYYSLDDLEKMIQNIKTHREILQDEYGFDYFQKMVDAKNQFLRKRKGFWENCKSWNDLEV